MYCRFEDRLKQTALELQGPRSLIQASDAQELAAAFEAIQQAQQAGYWVALALDYELSQLWEPRLAARCAYPKKPLLQGLVFEQAQSVALWESRADIELQAHLDSTFAAYQADIGHIRDSIQAGDYYQINYSVPISLSSQMNPRALYAALATRHPVAYACYMELEERRILSLSPELFLHRRGLDIYMRPMKGTMPRHPDPEQDQAWARQLASSGKDQAENLMIVDLLRNDLGQLAQVGSVQVSSLFDIEQYPSVWTMTSGIQAKLRPDVSLQTLLQAVFPCGSITGAPKLAAMQAIRQLESHTRGIYCGALGYLSPQNELQLNVAIRTLELNAQGQGMLGVGGGIVMDSTAEQEWQECLWKARVLHCDIQTSRPA